MSILHTVSTASIFEDAGPEIRISPTAPSYRWWKKNKFAMKIQKLVCEKLLQLALCKITCIRSSIPIKTKIHYESGIFAII